MTRETILRLTLAIQIIALIANIGASIMAAYWANEAWRNAIEAQRLVDRVKVLR